MKPASKGEAVSAPAPLACNCGSPDCPARHGITLHPAVAAPAPGEPPISHSMRKRQVAGGIIGGAKCGCNMASWCDDHRPEIFGGRKPPASSPVSADLLRALKDAITTICACALSLRKVSTGDPLVVSIAGDLRDVADELDQALASQAKP